jgi:oligopeptide transport system substrate-binding protein
MFSIIAAFGLVLAACGGDDTSSYGANGKPLPADQQVLRVRMSGEPGTIDPQLASGATEASIAKQIGAGLFTYDGDLKVVKNLAKEMPTVANGGISADGMTYKIEVAEDAKWSDGKAVTPADFVYGIQRALDPQIASPYAPFFYGIVGALDYNTALGTAAQPKSASPEQLQQLRARVGVSAEGNKVVYHLAEPTPSFLNLLAIWTSFPARQDIIEKYGASWTDPETIVSSGPFVLKSWEHDQKMTFEPNPYWAGEKPKLSRLEVNIITDDSVAYTAYLNGELDMVALPASAVREATNPGSSIASQVVKTPDLTTVALFMNNTSAPFDNALVRQAFGSAIDRDAYVQGVLQGAGQTATAWLAPGMPGYDAKLGEQYKFDASKAKDLLTKAGYPNGEGLPAINFIMVNSDANRVAGQFLQDQFKKNLGVDVTFEYLEGKDFGPRFVRGNYQASIQRWHADWPYPDNWLPAQFTTGSPNNVSRYTNPKFDQLMGEAMKLTDDGARLDKYSQAEKLMLDDAALVPLYNMVSYTLVKPNLKGLYLTGLDGALKGDWSFTKAFLTDGSGN